MAWQCTRFFVLIFSIDASFVIAFFSFLYNRLFARIIFFACFIKRLPDVCLVCFAIGIKWFYLLCLCAADFKQFGIDERNLLCKVCPFSLRHERVAQFWAHIDGHRVWVIDAATVLLRYAQNIRNKNHRREWVEREV